MLHVGDIVSYLEMCAEEGGIPLQRGMNYRWRGQHSVILMSVRQDAPYADRVEENGTVLIYEGHNVAAKRNGPNPKTVDQPIRHQGGSLTQNGLFHEAAHDYKDGLRSAELVKVYEKVLPGVWAYNGFFELVDSWQQWTGAQHVFKFRLRAAASQDISPTQERSLQQTRLIPTEVKLLVWKRDKG